MTIISSHSPNRQLSPHFNTSEFKCPCCGDAVIHVALVCALEEFRLVIDRPIIINSGYRCPEHNIYVGGSPKSQHVEGRACDVRVIGVLPVNMVAIARRFFNGVGLYDTWLHLDVREGRIAYWDKRRVKKR